MWVYLFSLENAMFGPFLACPQFSPLLGFCYLPEDIKVLRVPFGSVSFSFFFFFGKMFWITSAMQYAFGVVGHSCCFWGLLLMFHVKAFLFTLCVPTPLELLMPTCIL
jgi:hypothetical protein